MKALPDKEDRMHLTKEVKDILEGIHHFLVESLKNESLKGEVECQRRGLLLQLQALKEPYPVLHFRSNFDPNANIRHGTNSVAYFSSVEHVPVINGSSRMSTSSNGSTNYSTSFSNDSSTGYSGDGVVSSRDDQGETPQSASDDFSSEDYDDIGQVPPVCEMKDAPVVCDKPRKLLQRKDSLGGCDDKDDDDSTLTVDPVACRFLIVKCDHHGTLMMKRSKMFFQNSKSFYGVLIGTLLYLFQKETDERQKKVVDVSGYLVRDLLDESSTKRKDFGFELVQPGKKTHVFHCSRRKERDSWVENLKRADNGGVYQRNQIQRSVLAKVEESQPECIELDDSDSEVYEELGSEYDGHESALERPPLPALPAPVVYANGEDEENYYTVPDCLSENKPHRLPPERPPPPRPLPKAPQSVFQEEIEPTDDEIYCEIDSDFEAYKSMVGRPSNTSFSESVNSILLNSNSVNSLSQEIFEEIERLTPLPECNSLNDPKYDGDQESYDVPSERPVPCSQVHMKLRPLPSLPPKGVPLTFVSVDEDSEYKVPTFSYHLDDVYQVPPSDPVPVEIEKLKSSSEFSDSKKETSSSEEPEEIADLSSQTSASIDALNEIDVDKIDESSTKESLLCPETKTKNNNIQKGASNSVRDLIAMLDQRENENQNKTYSIFKATRQTTEEINNAANFNSNLKKIEVLQAKKFATLTPKSPEVKQLLSRKTSFDWKSSRSEIITSSNPDEDEGDSEEELYSLINVVYIANFDYVSASLAELSFSRGDEILVENARRDSNRWKATLKGKLGFVSKEYLRRKQ